MKKTISKNYREETRQKVQQEEAFKYQLGLTKNITHDSEHQSTFSEVK